MTRSRDPRPAPSGPAPASAVPVAVVTTTVPSEADATRIAEAVVSERLAACAQVHGPIHSLFRWQGVVDRATEWYVHCKTTVDRIPALMARIQALHPYEVPEIIASPLLGGYPPYLAWVEEMVREQGEGRSEK